MVIPPKRNLLRSGCATGHKESLHTSDRREAQRLRDARDDATQNPNLGLQRGKRQTQERRHRVAASKAFVFLRSRRILETTPQDFLSVLHAGGLLLDFDTVKLPCFGRSEDHWGDCAAHIGVRPLGVAC